jgi:hypothetical protein
MLKKPQNIIKFSSRSENGDYTQMVFDGAGMCQTNMMLRFENFLRGLGYMKDGSQSNCSAEQTLNKEDKL